MLKQTIKDCKEELKVLARAEESLRTVLSVSYTNGADLDFLEKIDHTLVALLERVAYVNNVKAQCHRKLEETGKLAKSLELA